MSPKNITVLLYFFTSTQPVTQNTTVVGSICTQTETKVTEMREVLDRSATKYDYRSKLSQR